MHFQAAAVIDETEFSKAVHEEVHARTGGADHFREHLLTDPGDDNLRFAFLAEMCEQQENASKTFLAGIEEVIDEVVLAMNATLEGQTTAHYLAERLERFPIRLTQLAHGLPVGGDLEYADEVTLIRALQGRRAI